MTDYIRQWLEELGLAKYGDAFTENGIDLDVIGELDNDDLKSIGVNLGDRKRLLRAIAASSPGSAALTTLEDSNATETRRDIAIPEHITERITAEAEERMAERKFVTVLFADIYQSTALTEDFDPEDARQLLDSAIDHMAAAVHRYDGIVNKVLGDGIMALFGAPLALEDHAVRACYAALSVQEALRAAAAETRREFGAEVQARIGLHSGEVLVRAIKNDFSVDYDATGPTVNIAARMEQSAVPGSIRLSHDTWRLVGEAVTAPSLGPLSIKGLSEPLEVFELHDLAAKQSHQAVAGHHQAPFTGRRQELSYLGQAWQSVQRGQGQAVIYCGEAGVGKSRLFQEFLDTLEAAAHVLRGGFPVHGKASAFQVMLSLLSDLFGIKADDTHEQLMQRISGELAAISNAGGDLQTPLLALFQVPLEDKTWDLAGPMQRRRRTLNALCTLFSRMAARSPLVLVFEDLQRADDDSLALFEELIGTISDLPILILLNHRDEFSHTWPEAEHCLTQDLAPLEAGRAIEMLDDLLGTDDTLADLKAMLVDRSGGNPLFLEEALNELVESGSLTGVLGRRTLTTGVDNLGTPGSVRGIIAARIDRLEVREKEMLQTAAVFGDQVPLSLLETIAEISAVEVRAAFARLNDLGYLFEAELFPDIVYRFKNVFIQQVTYEGILKSRRRQLHGRLAREIESRYGTRVAEAAEILAYHYEQGGIRNLAIKYLLVASEKAEAGFQYAAGAALCRHAALLAVDHDDLRQERCRALARQGDLVSLLGDWQQGNEYYDNAAELATDDGQAQEIALRRHGLEFVEHEGSKLAYLGHGAGAEVLLFVTPGAYNQALFQALIPEYCGSYRVVLVQLLGQGEADPPRQDQSLLDNARDVAAVARTLGGRVTGIGLSRASNMLVNAALENPGLFDRLVLVSAPADDGVEGSRFPRPTGFIAKYRAAVAVEDWHEIARIHASNLVPEPEAVDLRKLVEMRMRNINHDIASRFFDSNPTMDITDLVNGLPMPVLVMHGTADTQAPFSGSEYLAQQIPNSQHYAFEGKGHIPMQTATKEFISALSKFLASTG